MTKHLRLGLRLECLGLPLRKALAEASRMGVGGVQVDAVGDLSPKQLSASGRREFGNLLRSYNLTLTAVGCPLRKPLDTFEAQQERIEHVETVMTLATDLGPNIVIVEAGRVPEKEDAPEAGRLREALLHLSRHGDRTGCVLAVESGNESGPVLAEYLRTFDTGSLRANLDPANLLLNRFDPVEALEALAPFLAHTHARDVRRGSAGRAAREVALGNGDIDWMEWTERLEAAEYRGWIVVERLEGDNRVADVEAGVGLLRRFI